MDQKENKIYFSKLSDPAEFPQYDYSSYDTTKIQKEINELYAKIIESQKKLSVPSLFTIDSYGYEKWKEDHHKEFYDKFDKILK